MNHWSQLRFEFHTTLLTGIVLLSMNHILGGIACFVLVGGGMAMEAWRAMKS